MLELEKLLKMNESESLEFKKSENKISKSFFETYSAFANTDGGKVVLGFDEKNREVIGVKDPKKIIKDLFDTLNNQNKASYNILDREDVEIVEYKGKFLILINIPEAPYNVKPIFLNNNPREAYERVNEGDKKLSFEKYKAMVVGSNEITDNELLNNYDMDDLNIDTLKLYRDELYKNTNNEKYKNIDFKEMLIEIGALKKDRKSKGEYLLTTGALLLFGKYNSITDRFPGFQLDYFRKDSFLDERWLDRISTGDMEYPELNVFTFLKKVLEKFDITINDKFVLDNKDTRRLPFKSDLFISFREALVNVLMHAYYDSNTPIKIIDCADCCDFENPGKMRITVEEFISGGNSNIRNHTISSILRRIGLSEKAGSGGPKIFDTALKYNLKSPEIKRDKYSTTVRIWKIDLEKMIVDYPENERKIIKYLIQNYFINKKEANEKLDINDYSFRNSVKNLIDKNILESIGKGRSTKYTLKINSQEYIYSLKKILKTIDDNLVK